MIYKSFISLTLLCSVTAQANAMVNTLTQATTTTKTQEDYNAQLIAAAQSKSQYTTLLKIVELLQQGADVNTQDADGNTPIMLAAQHRHEDLAVLLYRNGANINLHNNKGEYLFEIALTPLVKAIKLAQADMASKQK